ncbi:hypothetical protein GCM10011450_04820 [Advenella faeciporci]|uniref:Uncharacterized protein n=1 Tax=Advenella faeciporci TaxID=797535 RepID=A0A918JIT7_9BURK|nr:hypothetical protein [Advenella faeciporci]NLY34424.1 hypothetical protein [Alcaligenaceae bacterium]GGW78009.1 hypothetical protein GCM10011450_04820 [Advenella faeciporci]
MKAHSRIAPLHLFFSLALLGSWTNAHAEQVYCQSPWLKPNGKIEGNINGGKGHFTIRIKQVTKAAGNDCHADLHIQANAPIAGQQINGSGNFRLMVNSGGSTLSGSFDSAGLLGTVMRSVVTSRVNGYFLKPANVMTEQSGSLPAQTYRADAQASMSLPSALPISQVNVENAFLQSAQRKIGKEQQIHTQMGSMSCKPVTYTGTISSGQIQSTLISSGKSPRSKPITVTEWYCPEKGLTMKMDIKSGNSVYTVAVTHVN